MTLLHGPLESSLLSRFRVSFRPATTSACLCRSCCRSSKRVRSAWPARDRTRPISCKRRFCARSVSKTRSRTERICARGFFRSYRASSFRAVAAARVSAARWNDSFPIPICPKTASRATDFCPLVSDPHALSAAQRTAGEIPIRRRARGSTGPLKRYPRSRGSVECAGRHGDEPAVSSAENVGGRARGRE